MSQIIAEIYEIQNQIGSGGGGIVYLGHHIRLDKQIILKADKRTLNTSPDSLRREVDMLKNLSHMYIPQVYDFVQEDGIVYTIMDYIEGESLDKVLEQGKMLSQPQVIRWACQLLEALEYLHSRPPYGILHGDIKPANIMLRPNGDICLIDYNIALALGEDGAVKVGYSQGYASPEHYGIEYCSVRNKKRRFGTVRQTLNILSDSIGKSDNKTGSKRVTVFAERSDNIPILSSLNAGSSGKHTITLDVRSDIYSLGATLYHLISGQHPADDAEKIERLGPEVCSLEVSKIIQKAMAPVPDMRYQSASEMLEAILQLPSRDSRMLRYKRCIVITSTVLSMMFLAGGASTFLGMRGLEQTQEALALSEYSANQLAKGDASGAIQLALQAIPEKKNIFDAPVTAQAQKALTDALGVYDLSDHFNAHNRIELPSAPFSIVISPNGTYLAAVYSYEVAIFDLESGERMAAFPIQESALSDVIFVDDSRVVYAGAQGVTAYDLKEERTLWTGGEATTLSVSGDGAVVAAVNRDNNFGSIYRMNDGEKIADCSFGEQHMKAAVNDTFANPHDRIFSLNETGDLLAVSFSDGGIRIFDLKDPREDMVIYDTSEYAHFEGGFCGDYFAFAADKSDKSLFGLIDTKKGSYVGGNESRSPFILKTGDQEIYLANGNLLVNVKPDTQEEKELAYTGDEDLVNFSVGNGYVLASTENQGFSIYDPGAQQVLSESSDQICDFVALAGEYGVIANRNEPWIRILKMERHEDTQIAKYDASYSHDEARVSHDGKRVMLFCYEDFRIYDKEGNLAAQVSLPEAEKIYDQQFRRSEEDSWLETIWYDGTVRCYSGLDGSLISEVKKEPPSKDLYEMFYTDQYRIESPLHGTPQVYDLKSNQKVAELEEEAYLTYVTQAGDNIVTEYISTEGERYGLLLNDKLEVLAELPNLCDIWGDMLVFDYGSGNLRQCRLYSLQELKALGEISLQK